MKEIGKLIELLNEYGNEICNHWGDYQTDMDFTDRDIYWYLSKKFGFIKWLVENDKIDTDIVYEKGFLAKTYDKDEVGEYFEPYEEILMLLAIQDEPIRFLCDILK